MYIKTVAGVTIVSQGDISVYVSRFTTRPDNTPWYEVRDISQSSYVMIDGGEKPRLWIKYSGKLLPSQMERFRKELDDAEAIVNKLLEGLDKLDPQGK